MNRSTSAILSIACVTTLPVVLGAGLAGCRGERTDNTPRQFLPGMDDQPRFRAQQQTSFFADGRIQRQPVQGTVAFGTWPVDLDAEENASWSEPWQIQRARLIKEDNALYLGVGPGSSEGSDPESASYWLNDIPTPVTLDLIKHGQIKFDIFCATCHGYGGEGGSGQTDVGEYGPMVGRRWSYPVPSFHDDKYQREAGVGDDAVKTGRDGYIFNVVRNGVPDPVGGVYPWKMPPYAHALNEHDAWAVVAYVRTLQESRRGSLEDVPEAERQRLNELRGLPTTDAGALSEPIASGGDS